MRTRLRMAVLTGLALAVLAPVALPAPATAAGELGPVGGAPSWGMPGADQARPDGGPRWVWPVAAPHPVVRGFRAPATAFGPGHRGIDVAAAMGTPVLAPDDGVVMYAGVLVDRGVVSVQHAGGVRSSFEPVDARVHAGERVTRGEVIGTLGTGGGHRPGVLHIGARIAPPGSGSAAGYVSPLLFLGGQPRAILLPMG